MAEFVEKEIDYAGLKKLVTAFDKLKLIEDGKIKVDKTDTLETLGQKYLDAVGKVPEDKEDSLTEEMVGAFNYLRKYLVDKKKEEVKEEKAAKSGKTKIAPKSGTIVEKKKAVKKEKGEGKSGSIKEFVADFIKSGKAKGLSNAKIADVVVTKFSSRTTASNIGWYKWKLGIK